MHLVKYPECACEFDSPEQQKNHDHGNYIFPTDKKRQAVYAKGVVSTWKRTEREKISDGELREVAMLQRIGNESGSGIHFAIACAYIWAYGEKDQKYCIIGTKRTIPGAWLE